MDKWIDISFPSLLLLFGLIYSLVIDARGDDDEVVYVFHKDKNIPISPTCPTLRQMNEIDRVILLATKNFLYNVKQHTPTDALQLPESEDMKFQRCKKEIYPDGNCLFRAIAYCVHKTEEEHTRVRKDVVRYVYEHWDYFKDFMIGANIYDQELENPEDYKKYMSGDKKWGGHVEIQAATFVYDICAYVYHRRSGTSQNVGDESKPFIGLYYGGDGYNGHFSVIEDLPLPGLAEPTDFTSENVPVEKVAKRGWGWSSTDMGAPVAAPPTKFSPLSPERSTKKGFSIWPKFFRQQASPPKVSANAPPPSTSPPSPPQTILQQPTSKPVEKEESNDLPPTNGASSIRVI